MASTFTNNLLLENATPLDPAQRNVWGTTENTGRTLVDAAVAGIQPLNLPAQTGYPTVILTSSQGQPDQARNAHFVFSGTLTANTLVLFPQSRNRMFTVNNTATGAFTVTVGVNNGSGAAAGNTVVVPQGQSVNLFSDGTNVATRVNGVVGGLTVSGGETVDNLTVSGTATVNNLTVTGAANLPAGALVPSGSVMPFAGISAPNGWLLANGQTISRTTYASLFSAITASTTGNTHTSATIDGIPSTAGWGVGWGITGSGIPLGATIASIVSGTSITISAPTTTSVTGAAIVVYPHGAGDGSTTFGVPDMRGRLPAGVDGGAGRLGSGTTGGITGAATLGAAGGEQGHINTVPEIPAHSHTGATDSQSAGTPSGTIGFTDLTHNHTVPGSASNNGGAGFLQTADPAGSATTSTASLNHQHGFTGNALPGHSHNVTTNNTGGGGAHNNVQPTLVLNYIVKT